jgi:hypothetical protein
MAFFKRTRGIALLPVNPLANLSSHAMAQCRGKFYVQSRHACTCGFMDGINRVLQVSTAGIPFCHFLVQLSTVGFVYMYGFD